VATVTVGGAKRPTRLVADFFIVIVIIIITIVVVIYSHKIKTCRTHRLRFKQH